jgi:hypothetical protein
MAHGSRRWCRRFFEKDSGSMSLLVLVLGLSGIATAVLVWYVRWRRERRAAEARLWQQHRDWLQMSEREQP